MDEDSDPKKYVQKLTGKLAQKLRDYNTTNEKDEELNKFVINSIIPASVPYMDSNNADDVVKKVKDNIGGKPQENGNDETSGEMPNDNMENNVEESINEIIDEIIPKFNQKSHIKNPFQKPIFK